MFIVTLTYKVSLGKIDQCLNEHIDYLNNQYQLGNFIVSGRKVPRTGGIILSKLSDKKELLSILERDPFKIKGLADYEITEFIPNKTSKELDFLIE